MKTAPTFMWLDDQGDMLFVGTKKDWQDILRDGSLGYVESCVQLDGFTKKQLKEMEEEGFEFPEASEDNADV